MPKQKVPCKCISIIMRDSVTETDEKYYLQTFLEECKYVQENIKFENYINEELDSDSNDEKESNIDNDSDTTKCDFIVLSQVNEISLTVNEFH